MTTRLFGVAAVLTALFATTAAAATRAAAAGCCPFCR